MINTLFITGTDTGVGKTVVANLLARFLAEKGINTITQKWIETGSSGISTDAMPYVFKFPSSPHLAALLENRNINTIKIKNSFNRLKQDFDFVIVEGTGGVLVPINEKKLIIDIARELCPNVVIVAENRLGAINQTLLAVEALKKRKLKIVGIVFNRTSKNLGSEIILKDNVKIIEKLSGIKVLGELCYGINIERLYKQFLSIGQEIIDVLMN